MSQRKSNGPPKVPPVPIGADLSATDRWYLECLTMLTKHLGRAPSCQELGNWIKRTATPVYRSLSRLESLGYCARDEKKRFTPTGRAP